MREKRCYYTFYAVIVIMLVMLVYFQWTGLPANIAANEANDKPKEQDATKPAATTKFKKPKAQLADLNISDRPSVETNGSRFKFSDDKVASNKARASRTLRDSIEMIHLSNFNKPKSEKCLKRLPTAIIVGVEKSGTRELLEFLHLHPHIQIYYDASRKSAKYEMLYFSTMYHKGVKWFKEQMPCSFSNQITVMKMCTYFHNKLVPERIQKLNESIKLILIVREPIARAYSAYTRTSQKSGTFSHFVIKNSNNEVQAQHKFVIKSIYDEYMEHWLKYFSLSQFLILEHGEFIQDPVTTLKKVERFLGLGDFISTDMFAFNSEKGFYCIKSNLTTTGMSCYGDDRGRPQEPITPGTRLKLTQFFAERNRRFFNIIGKSYDW